MANDALIKKIVGLFNMANHRATGGQRGATEAEVMLAITKAKELMVKHAISESDVQAALDATTNQAHKPRIIINTYTAYTRKIRNLARYDELVAVAVGYLTQTQALIYHKQDMDGKWYTTLKFVGEESDIQIASALFMIFLQAVRREASAAFGRGKNTWALKHTSYAIGFASRMCDRAQQRIANLTPKEQMALVKVTDNKQSAIDEWKKQNNILGINKRKGVKMDPGSYIEGYIAGEKIDLGTRGIR